jgi:hypothetical protein
VVSVPGDRSFVRSSNGEWVHPDDLVSYLSCLLLLQNASCQAVSAFHLSALCKLHLNRSRGLLEALSFKKCLHEAD